MCCSLYLFLSVLGRSCIISMGLLHRPSHMLNSHAHSITILCLFMNYIQIVQGQGSKFRSTSENIIVPDKYRALRRKKSKMS